jgi:hypothetical protein
MPKCRICGKELKNPNSSSHKNSKFHQGKLKKITVKSSKSSEVRISPIRPSEKGENIELRNLVLNLEKRISKIEALLKIDGVSFKSVSSEKKAGKFKSDKELEHEIVRIVNQRSPFQQIKGNIALKDLKNIFQTNYNVSIKEFEEGMLRLYRKQIIDLQPGGNPNDYHLLSPTGKKFYYLFIKP